MRIFLFIIFILFSFRIDAAVYRAISNGDWGDAAIWDVAPFDSFGGDGVPGAGDVAITNGFQIGLNPVYGDVTVDRITITNSVANSLYYNDPFFFFVPVNLTINLSLSSTGAPTVAVIENNANIVLNINGTGSSVINNWSTNAPFNNVTFNSGGSTTINSNIAIDAAMTVSSGTSLTIGGSVSFSDNSGSASITVDSGATLNVNGAINGDGTSSTRFNTIDINGTATTGTSGYINSTNFTLASSANLTVNFNGANQTQGWWFGSVGPTGTFDINSNSTITYNASADQNVGAATYGNLTLRSPSAASNKTLQSTNTLVVQGDFTINSANVTFTSSGNSQNITLQGNTINNGTWTPSQLVIFSGSAAQTISGNNQISFNGGMRVSNTSGLSLNNIGCDINGELDVDPSASFSPSDQAVTMSGNFRVDGSLLAGTDPSGFVLDGTTVFLGSGTRSFNDFTVTGSVTAPTGALNIAGDFANNGTFDANGGSINFNGTVAQAISGSGAIAFEDININNASNTVTLSAAADLVGIITLGSGSSFTTGGNLTLISNASGTATVAAIPSDATFTGNVNYQRYFGGAGEYWRNWGTPVAGTVTDITNAGFTINGNDLAYYNESATGTVDDGWVLQSTFGSSIDDTRGYSQWTRVEELPATIQIAGALNTGDVTLNTSYNNYGSLPDDGWNLVNNPYASTIDWGDADWTKTNLDAAAYVWNGTSYTTLMGTSGDYIASGQSFWVKANGVGATTLTATQGVKNNTSTTFLRTEEENQNWLKISLSDGEYEDIAHLRFRSEATAEFDSKYDGYKLQNAIFNFSSLTAGGMDLSVNSLPDNTCAGSVDLKLTNIDPGNYEITFNDFNTINLGYDMTLIDSWVGNQMKVSEGASYNFDVTSDPASYGSQRFSLQITSQAIDNNLSYSPTVEDSCDDFVTIQLATSQSGMSYSIKNSIDGNDLSNAVIGTGGAIQLYVLKSLLSLESSNEIDLYVSGNQSCVSDQLIENILSFNISGQPQVSSVEGASFCTLSEVTLRASGASQNGFYRWYAAIDSNEILAEEPVGEFTTNPISSTTSYYVSVVSSLGCESERVAVSAVKTNLNTPVVSAESICNDTSTTLLLSGAEEGQFYKLYESVDASEALKETSGNEMIVEGILNSRNYYVSLANASGCESEKTVVFVDVISLETPTIEVQGQELSTVDAEEYQWYLNGEKIVGATEKTFFVTQDGDYSVEIFNSGCSISSESITMIVTDLDDALIQMGVSVFPNPMSSVIKIEQFSRSARVDFEKISLFDSNGQLVRTDEDVKQGPNGLYIDVMDLRSGLYILNIYSKNRIIAIRLQKH